MIVKLMCTTGEELFLETDFIVSVVPRHDSTFITAINGSYNVKDSSEDILEYMIQDDDDE